MLKAIIFDCDGVISDTEPIHMTAFQRVLAEEGITLGKEDYFARYLALDDRGCFRRAFGDRGDSLAESDLKSLIGRKSAYVDAAMEADLKLLPGAAKFIKLASASYPLAVASGALRHEIELILRFGGVRDCFQAIVSAEDVERSKPYPDPFIKAFNLLRSSSEGTIELGECLVIEDSIHGVRAAHEAGMRCVAITNSYPAYKLEEADLIIDSLDTLSLRELESLFID
jgi:HAD superfamily hydrolase (TIGR01509 family)